MQRSLGLAVLATSLFAGACGDTNAKEPGGTAPSMSMPDLGKMAPAEMQKKATDLAASVSHELATITDKASAMKANEAIGPLADQLKALKEKLGASLPSLSSLQPAIDAVKAKFGGDSAVMAAIQPALDKLAALLK